jgi:hypothetical protein
MQRAFVIFYKNVVGWKSMDVGMGEYNDFCMLSPEDNEVRTGICHARGVNAGIPRNGSSILMWPTWMKV